VTAVPGQDVVSGFSRTGTDTTTHLIKLRSQATACHEVTKRTKAHEEAMYKILRVLRVIVVPS